MILHFSSLIFPVGILLWFVFTRSAKKLIKHLIRQKRFAEWKCVIFTLHKKSFCCFCPSKMCVIFQSPFFVNSSCRIATRKSLSFVYFIGEKTAPIVSFHHCLYKRAKRSWWSFSRVHPRPSVVVGLKSFFMNANSIG